MLPAFVAVAVIAVLVAFGLVSTVLTHASIPQNDDWSYLKSAFHLHRTGHVQLQGWGQMFLVGQLYTSQPLLWVFGDHVLTLNAYGSIAAAIWLWGAFVLSRRCVGAWRAVAVVAAIALWPGLGLLSSSFMTDMPAWAMSLLTVVVGVRAIERQSRWWLLLALLVGLFSFTIREQMVAGVGAVLVGLLLSRRSSNRFRLEAVLGVLVTAVLCVLLEHVRHGLPNPDLAPFSLADANFHKIPSTAARLPYTIGLELSPLVLLAVFSLRGRQWLHPGRLVGWAIGLGGILFFPSSHVHGTPAAVLTNFLTRSGAFTVASVGTAPPIFGGWLWAAVELFASLCGVLLLGEIGARIGAIRWGWPSLRSEDGLGGSMTAYTVILAVTSVALAFANQPQVDRYQLGMLPGLAMMLLARRSARPPSSHARPGRLAGSPGVQTAGRGVGTVVVAAAGVLLAYLSVVVTVHADRRDHAVWAASQRLQRSGIAARTINGGLNWDGYAASPTDRYKASLKRYPGQQWTYLFPAATDCYLVSVSALSLPNLQLMQVTSYPDYRIWTYVNHTCRTPLTNSGYFPAP